jgi:Tol biopolymer transport system component
MGALSWRMARGTRLAAGGALAAGLALALTGAFWYWTGRHGDAPALAPASGTGSVPWQLVYERVHGDEADLYLVPAAGGVERRVTREPGYDGLPRFTPDGKRIVFTSGRSGPPQLWEIGVEGGRPRRLRENGATEYQADVSPDGGRLAFLSNLDGPERLMVEDLRSGEVRELVRHGDHTIFGNPHWSPDGTRIVFSSNWRIGHHIYLVEVATGKTRRLSPLASGGCEPRFSRDGRRVVYVGRDYLRAESRLVEHDLTTGQERTLVDWPALNYDPVYSPDGSELAFASNIAGRYEIYRQRLADGRAWRVTYGTGDARNPDYRPVPSGGRVGQSR